MTALRQIGAIVAKDLLIEWRTRDLLSTMGIFGLAAMVLFNFAIDFTRVPFAEMGAPILWLAFLFTSMAGLSRSFALENENRCLEGILLAPVDRSVVYAGKLAVNVLVLLALQAFLVALGLGLLNQGRGRVELDPKRWALLAGVVALHAIGFAAVGTLFALMAQRTRRGDVLLPVLQAVLTLPVLVSAVIATQRLFRPDVPLDDVVPLVRIAAGFDVVFVAVALIVFEYVVEE